MSIPKFVKKYIEEEGIKRVEETIARVEKHTSAELVAVVVKNSSTTGHVPAIILLLGLVLYFIFDVRLLEEKYLGFLQITFIPYLLLLLIATFLLNQLDWVKRMLTPAWDQGEQVEKRALLEFYQSNIKKTKDGTGILFFISVLERKAIVLADQIICDQLPADTWTAMVNLITSGMKQKDLASGLEKALINSGNILKPLFPVQLGDIDELPNKLIIKE
ncbi:MAG: hypothetical protein A2381_00015 [Bdellovibrionales bacterium RIFOXYB1_FULL_37_110]|nr:MAG: hypothetical protein A2181_06025 [Bdellovibrionales bacterium RIFOXYA1_FULL_38_20]OFZ49271.1 MAG: hypothetical protein A2417_17200 [Bdellovibrionales bacterium RIFOXYC1_FULL_37_79]OFZ57732.1 MAG: hypothetical protein A2381_00015 [Bdellovibrionales bacterium RIFOXYB1_FULL_37_110]OFZ61532.1 MAG: hypothetical protein A2577_00480 [Bdellovibrionales bacterium RIFOXYD1_FULL_36_51]